MSSSNRKRSTGPSRDQRARKRERTAESLVQHTGDEIHLVAGPGYFPEELHRMVIEYLRNKTLGKVATVSKAFGNLALRELERRMRELARRHEPEPMRWAADHNHIPLLRYLSPYERDDGGRESETALKLALRHTYLCFAKELVTLDTTLTDINLGGGSIEDEGATALGRALEKNSTLTEL